MLVIAYEGWFQCRMASDPDPTNDPRGISGPTIAVAGEPDFDRVIRLQEPIDPRYPHKNDIGVDVRAVGYLDPEAPPDTRPTDIPDHPLVGAKVAFLTLEKCGGSSLNYPQPPRFHQRNYIVVPGLRSPIDPVYVEIAKEDLALRRQFHWDVTRPCADIRDVFTEPSLYNNQKQTIAIQDALVGETTGILDYAGYRQNRAEKLRELLEGETDPIRAAGLEKRISGIEKDKTMVGTTLAAQQFLGMRSPYSMELNGVPEVCDPEKLLKGTVGTSQNWPFDFWMGAYDVDALCGYMKGTLSVAFQPKESVT